MSDSGDNEAHSSTLGVNFARAQRQLQALNNSRLASSSEDYQKQAKGLVELLKVCARQVGQLSLFSSNETTDDYSTGELKLILINAYLGEALQKLNSTENRMAILKEAQECYKEFLFLCSVLGVAKQPAARDSLAQTGGPAGGSAGRAVDPGVSRMQKIERFKRVRAMQQDVAELEARLAGRGGKEEKDEEEDMEDVEREYAIKLIELKVHQVTDDLDILKSEIDMARQMEEMRKPQRNDGSAGGKSGTGDDSEWRLDPRSYRGIDPATGQPQRPVFNSRGQPMQPFVLTNDRQRIKDQAFRPGWAMPTMTVDEYLEQERERGNIISGGGKEPDAKPEIDDNDHEALDAETMKQREWDNFKDDNPKGWGNRGGNRG
ncbi:TAP42-like protein [Martensiomyces pterosporus]|nr:TAP42-like protein [Martensiomyces pterosporus]